MNTIYVASFSTIGSSSWFLFFCSRDESVCPSAASCCCQAFNHLMYSISILSVQWCHC